MGKKNGYTWVDFGKKEGSFVETETIHGRLPVVRGELALLGSVAINSGAVTLMLCSGYGISTISSLPYTISRLFPQLTLGTWNYIFQTMLVLVLMVLRRRFVPNYLFAFAAGVAFGVGMDIHELWISRLPLLPGLRVVYFLVGMTMLSVGIGLGNRCRLPIIPTDLFPREVADIFSAPYRKVKTGFDLMCLTLTLALSLGVLGDLKGVGIGTAVNALVMGSMVARVNDFLDKRVRFVSVLEREPLP